MSKSEILLILGVLMGAALFVGGIKPKQNNEQITSSEVVRSKNSRPVNMRRLEDMIQKGSLSDHKAMFFTKIVQTTSSSEVEE